MTESGKVRPERMPPDGLWWGWRRVQRRLLTYTAALAFVAVLLIVFRPLPSGVRSAARQATSFELLSVDPELLHRPEDRPFADFHRHRSLGRATIDATTARRLLRTLDRSRRTNLMLPSLCFTPRHGLRLIRPDGHSTDLVICFECQFVRVYDVPAGDTSSGVRTPDGEFVIGLWGQTAFDDALTTAGLPRSDG